MIKLMPIYPHRFPMPRYTRILRRWCHIRQWLYTVGSPISILPALMACLEGTLVVIEGSNSLENGWREYEFFYKPGAINRRPPVVAPHQPRLDWQMWFAALGSYQHNPWFLNLVYRLLDNETDVLDLIQYNPFPNKPPKYIRAQLYKYHYTKYGTDKNSSGWWTRELTREYLPALSKDDSSLVSFMKQTGIIESGKKSKSGKSDASFVSRLVSWIRRKIGQPEGFVFVMTVILTALTTKLITRTILS
ncbi:hypothetical protein DPMN_000918 [Dreissena polymorpha]|uniref:Lipase maturation factor 2 n=1 Tax=Dreissena polymorpha TaxID=45954 RepID=A0A9D4MKP8_DREPO|nr:hypothetical protein DPMN_000918 [Dreissena polymorpha]